MESKFRPLRPGEVDKLVPHPKDIRPDQLTLVGNPWKKGSYYLLHKEGNQPERYEPFPRKDDPLYKLRKKIAGIFTGLFPSRRRR